MFGPRVSGQCDSRTIISRGKASIVTEPVSRSASVFGCVATSVSLVTVSRIRFFSSRVMGIVRRLTSDKRHIVTTKLSRSFHKRPFNRVPTVVSVTRLIAGLRTIYTIYNSPTDHARHLVGKGPTSCSSPIVLINTSRTCRPHYHRRRRIPGSPGILSGRGAARFLSWFCAGQSLYPNVFQTIFLFIKFFVIRRGRGKEQGWGFGRRQLVGVGTGPRVITVAN